eukprot:1351621-Amphidinium_carterae.2
MANFASRDFVFLVLPPTSDPDLTAFGFIQWPQHLRMLQSGQMCPQLCPGKGSVVILEFPLPMLGPSWSTWVFPFLHTGGCWRSCRRINSGGAMQGWNGKKDDEDWVPSLALQAQVLAACSDAINAIKGPSTSSLVPSVNTVKQFGTPTLKLGLVISQALDEEVQILDDGIMSRCYTRYRNIIGRFPSEGQETTQSQISAIHALLDRASQLYADFAV